VTGKGAVKFLCEQCKAKYQIADDKAAGKTVRMKCRKCGYLIEVRAAPADSSTSGSQPPAASGSKPPGAASKPAPPRAGPLATSLSSARSPMKPAGPLANALKSALQREDEVSAPVDMSDLSPSDEWYVAINGVPVGPIRIGEVRRKAAIGAVTDESLCWQEGLDEWRPLRSFPELAALVREALGSGRSSMTPQPPPADGRGSLPPPGRTSTRPAGPAGASLGTAPRAPAARGPMASAPPPGARSNVVPFTARHATAEKLAEEPDDLTRPFTGPPITPAQPIAPIAQPDPFAAPPRPSPGPMAPGFSYAGGASAMAPSPSMPPGSLAFGVPAKKGPPWMAIAMVAAATAFGVTAAVALFLRPPPQPTPVVVQVPGAPATVAAAGTATAPAATASSDTPDLGTPATPGATKPVAMAAAPRATTSATAPAVAAAGHGPLNLQGLTGTSIAPTEDPGGGGDSPKAPGQCISEGQVQQVIGLHSVGLRRACWERSTASKTTANVTVSLTIGADGSAQGVSASGDEASVASCIASDVKNWHFPAMGCSQRTAIPFHFVRQ
jgi:predicted Zn finger-like uncharacterized protein